MLRKMKERKRTVKRQAENKGMEMTKNDDDDCDQQHTQRHTHTHTRKNALRVFAKAKCEIR